MKKPLTNIPSFFLKEQWLFLFIVLLEVFQFIFCIASNRLVVHDTFFRFYMQYYFLNNYVNYLEIPFWIPYLTHGTLATPWQGLVGIHGIFNNALFLTGPLLKDINFLSIFHTSVFFDRLLLFTGSWLLSRRLYHSPVVSFFVCGGVMVSSVWASQIHLNFLFYYAIPLIIHLLHRFLETQQWRYFLLGFNLFFLQCIDKLFYFLPVVSLTIFLYFFFYTIFNLKEMTDHFKKMRLGLNGLTALSVTLLTLFVIFTVVKSGMGGEIVKNIVQRNANGSVPLDIFLNYSKDNSLTKWLEVFLGISIKNDNTLYCGILIPTFALFGLFFGLNRKSLPVFLTCLVLFLFSLGSLVSLFFYYSWPTMKYYRHIFQAASIVRLFLCFFAGFGLLKLLGFMFSPKRSEMKICWLSLVSLVFFTMGLTFVFQSNNASFIAHTIKPLTYDADLTQIAAHHRQYSSVFKFLGIKYIFCSLLIFFLLLNQKRQRLELALAMLVIFHAFDGYTYSLQEFKNRTIVLTEKQLKTMQFQPIPFHDRRSLEDFSEEVFRHNILTEHLLSKSILSWNIHAFLFTEPWISQLRTDHWLKSYDQYVKVFSLNNHNPSEAEEKFSGLTENKIQFFEHAYVADLQTTADILSNPEFSGDILFLESEKNKLNEDMSLAEWRGQASLMTNERAPLSYKITFFSSNRLGLFVDNPTDKRIWLFYSDVWHPFWKAKVNDQSAPVYKASIAYKAVQLVPGANDILFYFSSPIWNILTLFIIVNSFLWLWYIMYLFMMMGRKQFRPAGDFDHE